MLASTLRFRFVEPQPCSEICLEFSSVLSGIVWGQLNLVTMSRLNIELMLELALRQLDTFGLKEELIKRFDADIKARCDLSPPVTPAAGSSTLSLDSLTLQILTVMLQNLSRQSATVATLPYLFSSLPPFEGSP